MSLPENRPRIKPIGLAAKVHRAAVTARRRGDLPSAGLLDAWGRGLASNPAEAAVSDWLRGMNA